MDGFEPTVLDRIVPLIRLNVTQRTQIRRRQTLDMIMVLELTAKVLLTGLTFPNHLLHRKRKKNNNKTKTRKRKRKKKGLAP